MWGSTLYWHFLWECNIFGCSYGVGRPRTRGQNRRPCQASKSQYVYESGRAYDTCTTCITLTRTLWTPVPNHFQYLDSCHIPFIPSLGQEKYVRLNGDQGEMKKPAKFADKQVLRENIFMIGARRAALTPGFPRPGLGRDKKKLAGWIMIHNLSGLTYGWHSGDDCYG